ncbi:hypothetical protein B5M42_017425 [Paenibacillus athensensis]|nr:macrolide family glycosyltransferase [Paenibacillus athensensis]MCD1260586.1 hypothetical protein [Paenibacillus athensensis]
MAKVIYFSVDLHGHVNPTLGLMKKLVEHGEEVIYYSSDEFKDKIEETGASYRSYEGLVGFGTYDGGGIETFLVTADFILNRSKTIVDHFMDDIRAFQPDYIIHDAFCYWGREFAAALGIPGITLFDNFAYIDEMADIDPAYFMENVLRAADDPMYKKHKDGGKVYRKLLDRLSKVVSMKYGMNNVNVINDIFCAKEGLNILLTSKAFQLYPEAFNDEYHFSGYSIYPRKETVDFPFELLDGRPLLYIAFGTIFNELEALYAKCMQAFGGKDMQVVLSVGGKVKLDELGPIPDNFIVRPYVPQLEILKRAQAFITHGGANSIHESLCLGVPLVVAPQSFDQFMGAMAVRRSGAGIFLQNHEITADDLAQSVQRVLTESSFVENVRRIRDSFAETGGLEATVQRIFAYVKERSKSAATPEHMEARG